MMLQLPQAATSLIDKGIETIYGLGPIFAPTVVLVPGFIKENVQILAEQTGFDKETLSYTLGLFLCYPLGLIMNSLPHGKTRHIFSFLLGAFLLQATIGVQWIHQMITSLVAYLLFMILPRQLASKVVPAFALLYLVFGHLHRQYINYLGYDFDFTGTQMVLTQKLYMMAYNLHDGEVLAQGKDSKAAKKCAKFALPELPGLIEFLGYAFCFSNVLAGPACEFTTYRNACDGSLLYTPDGKPKGKIPSNVMPTLRPFLLSICMMGSFVFLGGIFPLLNPENPQTGTPAILQSEFLAKPFVYRLLYLYLCLVTVRQKYYFAWKNAEGANNIWYAGFEGFDDEGNPKGWDTANNIDIWEFETAPNIQTLSKSWNKKTSMWLQRYVYFRTNGSLAAVYSMSAFWHGFYPGYYFFFLSVPIMTFCERLARKKISPYFSPEKWSLYGVLCMIATSLCSSYMVSSFVLLAAEWSWANWKNFFFLGHFGCMLFYITVSQLPSPKKKTV